MKMQILPQTLTVCQLEDKGAIPWDDPLLFLGKTDAELSLVCTTASAPAAAKREDGWRAMRITGQLDFALVGILAPIATVLADNQVGIFAVSTYDTDYILVKQESLAKARQALTNAGYVFVD